MFCQKMSATISSLEKCQEVWVEQWLPGSLWGDQEVSNLATTTQQTYTERYKYNGSFGIGLLSSGGEARNFLISSKAVWQSLFHSNFLAFFKARNSGRHFLAEHEMNRPSAVFLPLSFWSSFKVLGAFILRMASIFSGFGSMPLCEIMNPKNFPAFTPKTHLSGLSLILYLSKVSSICSRSLACCSDF